MRQRKKLTAISISLLCLLFVVACSENTAQSPAPIATPHTEATPTTAANPTDPPALADIAIEAQSDTIPEILTKPGSLHIMQTQSQMFETVEIAKRFMEKYPYVTVTVTERNVFNYEEAIIEALMSGDGPDLFESYRVHYFDTYTAHHRTDFTPILYNDPTLSPHDFFLNVLEACRVQNKLYVFPLLFDVQFMTVNRTVSNTLTDAFSAYDTVNVFDLLAMYKRTPIDDFYYLYEAFDTDAAFYSNLTSFIDFETMTCDFDNTKFIQLLTDAKQAALPTRRLGSNVDYRLYPYQEKERSLRYLFHQAKGSNLEYFLPGEEATLPDFTHLIPLTNEHGQVLFEMASMFCMNAGSENKELAWEFLKFAMHTQADMAADLDRLSRGGVIREYIPIYKPLLEKFMSGAIGAAEKRMWRFTDSLAVRTATMVAYWNAFDWPMYRVSAYQEYWDYSTISSYILSNWNGEIMPQEMSKELQQVISFVLEKNLQQNE